MRAGELALAQVARPADLPHLAGNLQASLGRSRHGGLVTSCGAKWYGLLDIEGPVAFSAEGVGGSVLHQPAVLTPHNFACLHADKSGGHRLGCGAPEQDPGVPFSHRDRCYCRGSEP